MYTGMDGNHEKHLVERHLKGTFEGQSLSPPVSPHQQCHWPTMSDYLHAESSREQPVSMMVVNISKKKEPFGPQASRVLKGRSVNDCEVIPISDWFVILHALFCAYMNPSIVDLSHQSVL